MTIAAALRGASDALRSASSSPALDARVLLQSVLQVEGSAVVAYAERPLEDAQAQAFAELVARRRQGEPVAYILGYKEFFGLPLRVDGRVLVPRPETELLVATIVNDWRGRHAKILDLGTGSGNIACALATNLPDASIIATDVSRSALEVATVNIARLCPPDTVELMAGDLFAPLPAEARFDAIAANLPYVIMDDPALDDAVRRHEPRLALDGGADGLAVYRRMLLDAPQRLEPHGSLYLEAGPANIAALADLVKASLPLADVSVYADLAGSPRLVVART